MIEDGVSGLLFPPGDAGALADSIRRLKSDRALGCRLGEAARAVALQTFAIREHVRQVEGVYERIFDAKRAQAG